MSPPVDSDLARLFGASHSSEAIAQAIESAWKRAQRAHAAVAMDEESFVRHLARHFSDESPESIRGAHAEDLYLALGCARGDAEALARFEAAHLREVPAFVAHLRLAAHEIEELVQALRVRLLAPRPDGPKILGYSGKGPLGGWVRVAAVRLAMSMPARRAEQQIDDDAVASASLGADPELGLARANASAVFKTAFERSLAELDPKERTVLRMHYLDGLTIDQIGVAYAVHRATAARWLTSGRDSLAARTRSHLRALLGVAHRDLDSVMRLVDSQLDLSLHRAFGGPSPVDDEGE